MERDEIQAVDSGRITDTLRASGIELAEAEGTALARYLQLLARWNRVHNLTGLRDVEQMIGRHLLESLALRWLLRGGLVADVGSGGGLPGIPLAVVEPRRQFTLIESRAKRVHFLRHAIGVLGLRNVTVAHARAEELTVAAPFDTVLARAVVGPVRLVEITRHLTRPGSILLLLTAAHVAQAPSGLPADVVPRQVVDERALRAIGASPGSIMLLERLDA